MTTDKREKLIAQLKDLNFYWQEISAGKSDEELEKIIAGLKQDRKIIKGIFNYNIFGKTGEGEGK
jgi:hypothetical protein